MPRIRIKYIGLNNNDAFKTKMNNLKRDFLDNQPRFFKNSLQRLRNDRGQMERRRSAQGIGDPAQWLLPNVRQFQRYYEPIPDNLRDRAQHFSQKKLRTKIELFRRLEHWLKGLRQRVWLEAVENFTYRLVKPVLDREIAEDQSSYSWFSPRGWWESYYKKHPLYIIALPEFYFTSIDDRNRHGDIKNYNKPFYSEAALYLAGNDKPRTPGFKRLKALTQNAAQNVMIIAGTIRWKILSDRTALSDTIYNTVTVFHGDAMQFESNKILTSIEDGSGNPSTPGNRFARKAVNPVPGRFDVMARPDSYFTPDMPRLSPAGLVRAADATQPIPAATQPIPAGYPITLPRPVQGMPNAPVFPFDHQGETQRTTLTVGVDICADFDFPSTNMTDRINNFPHMMAGTSPTIKPDIHVLIAGGMSASDTGGSLAFVRCDAFLIGGQPHTVLGIPDEGGNFTPVPAKEITGEGSDVFSVFVFDAEK